MTALVPLRKRGEDCGVIAVYLREGRAAELVHRGLMALQHRGQEAAGICTWTPDGEWHLLKGRGLVTEALPTHASGRLPGSRAIGHVRYSTVAMDRAENIQPFAASTPFGRLAVAHNGNLKNADALRREIEGSGGLLSTSMDTELLVHLVARARGATFRGALRAALARIEGAYSLAMLCGGRLYGLRDPNGVRPLVAGELPNGWVIASETCALEAVGARLVAEVGAGELVEIGPEGLQREQLVEPARPAPCVFELVYFARPDSTVFGQSVHAARTRMGEELAAEDLREGFPVRPDVVIPVPDSGVPAAAGYACRSGIPLEMGMIRSHYIGRTFILPDQDSRSHSLRLKLSVVREAVEGRRVVLVDDSLVRGNTSRLIVRMVRDAGAREVWIRIASPPLAWPCYLGIDTPDRRELLINRVGDASGVQKYLEADSLRYLSLEGLDRATKAGVARGFCRACMDGDYP